jgi:hypothetical protein
MDERDAVTYDTWGEVQDAMTAAELGAVGRDYEIVPLEQP